MLKTALELCRIKIRSQVQTITRAILPRNQSPSVSNSQRGWSYKQIFDSSTTFLNPLVGTNSLYGKRTACEARALRALKTLTSRFTDFFTDFERKNRLFCCLFFEKKTLLVCLNNAWWIFSYNSCSNSGQLGTVNLTTLSNFISRSSLCFPVHLRL